MYIDILRCLRDAVRKKRPEKWRTNSWFLLRDNAPAHRSVLIKNFLAKNNVTTLDLPPYYSDLPPRDFICSLNGRHFCDGTDIIKNATEELKRFLQNGFQECFQHIYSRWQKCIAAEWDYFEGNIA